MSTIKRPYNSSSRQAKALQTRNRVLDTARKLFETEGIEPVTIEKIAKTAEVSAPTIYLLFQSKLGILRALMDEALPTEQFATIVEQINQEKSPKVRCQLNAKLARLIYDAELGQMNLFRGAAALSSELKELENEREIRRFNRQEESITWLERQKFLKPDLSLAKARDIVWAFSGRDLYRLLVVDRSWSSDEYEAWLADILISTLLRDMKGT